MVQSNESSPRLDIKLVLTALEDQLDCYRRLADLSRQQADLIKQGETTRLLDLLRRRERQTVAAAELERSLVSFKRTWPRGAELWSQAERDEVEAMLAEARDLLAELTRRDEQDALSLKARMSQTKTELDTFQCDARQVRRVNQHYAAAAYGKRPGGMDYRK